VDYISKSTARPIAASDTGSKAKGFIDIIKIGAPSPEARIWKSLLNKVQIGNWA
jgi:hypothetical protein